METQAKRLQYSGIALGAVLVMAFVLVQPTMQRANAVGVEGLPGYDTCRPSLTQAEDPISMNTVRSGNIVKTIHAEKEIFRCDLDQGELEVIADVTTYIEVYENIVTREVLSSSAVVTTCLKDENTSTVIDCESYVPPTSPVFVGSGCEEGTGERSIKHPQEMNTVNKGITVTTIETQKEVFFCTLTLAVKKVDVVTFTIVFENLATQTVDEVQFHAMRCVVLITDQTDDLRDATVETCQFSTIQN
ncbi:MAG: hypothetical protein HMLIMOIP_000371 [Candidatus Nitrosomirales archaeon]|jgi:hypothetical protein